MKQEYYFGQMNKIQQAVYRGMLEGFQDIRTEIPVPKMENYELSDIFFRLRLDHPSVFYVNGFSYRFTQESHCVKIIPDYMFEKKKIKEHQKSLDGRISRLVRQAEKLSEEEKEQYIHDFICSNVKYDKLKKQYSHEIIGPLQTGVGVCEGIAKTVKILCDHLNIPCIIAVSEANPEKGIRYRHAWNLVKIKGSWYHLDVTFDNSLGRYGEKRFDYYNLDDKKIFRDHQPLVYPLPACTDGNHFWYKEKRLSLTRQEEVGKRLKAVLRKKQPYFVFHWRGGTLNQEILKDIVREASTVAAQKNLYVKLSVNIPQSVLEIAVLKKQMQEEICVEEADENSMGESMADA